MNRRAWLALSLLGTSPFFIAACTTPTLGKSQKQSGIPHWSGRLGLTVSSEPPESFSATFELKGTVAQGELTLISPIGTTLATLEWSPGEARLRSGQDTQQFDSVETLTRHVTGTALPLRALFDWLDGVNTTAGGWLADLSRLDQGHLVARRAAPVPVAELRLVLDR